MSVQDYKVISTTNQNHKRIAKNSLVVVSGTLLTKSTAYAAKATAGDIVLGVATQEQQFGSDNESQAKETVLFRPIDRVDQYRMKVRSGQTATIANVGETYQIYTETSGEQTCDLTTGAAAGPQLEVVDFTDGGNYVIVQFLTEVESASVSTATVNGSIPEDAIVVGNGSGTDLKDSGHTIDEIFQKPTLKVTETSSEGGHRKNIDDATGDTAQTLTTLPVAIEDEKFGRFGSKHNSGGNGIAEFDTAVKRTGDKTLKMEFTGAESGSAQIQIRTGDGNTFATLNNTKYGIPVKASTKYRWGFWYKAEFTGTPQNGFDTRYACTDGDGGNLNNISFKGFSTANTDRIYYEATLITHASAEFINLCFRIQAALGYVRIDVNSMVFEEVVEATNSGQIGVQDGIGYIIGKTTDENIDRELNSAGGSTFTCPTIEDTTNKPVFTAIRKRQSKIVLDVDTVGTSDLFIKMYNPSNVLIASIVASNGSLTAGKNIIDLPYINDLSANRYFTVTATGTITTPTVLVSTGATQDTVYAQGMFLRNTNGVRIRSNGETMDLNAGSAYGILEGSLIDLENGVYKRYLDRVNYANRAKRFQSLFDYSLNQTSVNQGVNTNAIQLNSGNYCIRKVDTILPIEELITVVNVAGLGGVEVVTLARSTDNVTYTDLGTLNANRAILTGTINNPGVSCIYIKLTASGGGQSYLYDLRFQASLDTSGVKVPKVYPTGTTETETLLGVATDTTTVLTYRETKYGFPAIEYEDTDHILLPFDLRDCSACTLTVYDETATQIGTGSLSNDGDTVSITSEDKLFMVFDFIKSKNSIGISTMDIFSDAGEDSSMQVVVGILQKSQGMYYDILEMKQEIGDLALNK